MKKTAFIIAFIISLCSNDSYSQTGNDTIVYLLTCNPGTETYSIYGHSALRIVTRSDNTDLVYNWGVFDFSTPNFAWNFAKGRLEYKLDTESINDFLRTYLYEKRAVFSQRINLSQSELRQLILLINENLKPENVKYRYDFFYDDCSTRIRDLLEKSLGEKMLYPPEEPSYVPTFRDMTGKYQSPYPWLKFGIDLIMGSQGDKKTTVRDRMFLPLDMQTGLSGTVVNRNGKMVPLLQNPETILDFDLPSRQQIFLYAPENVFSLILILLIIILPLMRSRSVINAADIVIFFIFSVLAILMIFFNFFTDHQQMKMNLNILWLNPVILICFVLLITGRSGRKWFRLVFYISTLFLVLQLLLPQDFSIAILPLVMIMILRSSARCGFAWNPFSLKQPDHHLTKV
jgi:hypothetical protein